MPRQRMNDRETESRMLDAAVKLIYENGLQVNLEGIIFDDVVRRAGVSRTSAYRRWPNRDFFYGDVLVELAKGTALKGSEDSVLDHLRPLILERAASLTNAQEHRNLVVEILRLSLQADQAVTSKSPRWRTFHTLLASYSGLSDPQLRHRVGQALNDTIEEFNQQRALLYAQSAAFIGYRLVPPLEGPQGFGLMSRALGSLFLGVIQYGSIKSEAEVPRLMRAFGSTEQREWTPTVYTLAAGVLSYVEPDPSVRWDAGRIEDLLPMLDSFMQQ